MQIISSHRVRIGLSCVLSGLLLVMLGCTRRPNNLGDATALAVKAPKEVYSVMLFDLTEHVDLPGWARDMSEFAKSGPRAGDFEKEVGMSPEQWIRLFNGRGYVAVLDEGPGQNSGPIACLGLADAGGFDAWWKKQAEGYDESGEETTIENVSFRVFDDMLVGHDQQWLYLATDEKNAARVVAVVRDGVETLDKNGGYDLVLKELGVKSPAVVAYADLPRLTKKAQEMDLEYTDETTYQELAALGSVVFTANFKEKSYDGFLQVLGESALAKQLTTAGQVKGDSLTAVSGSVTGSTTLDAQWTVNTLLKLGMVLTESRQYAGMAGIGLMSQGDPWAAFQGEVTTAGDFWEVGMPMLISNFTKARTHGQMTACKSNLKNMGTALEMYSTDWSGRYPKEMGVLTPNYLRTIPNCPVAGSDTYSGTLKVGTDPDSYEFYCEGNHHGTVEPNYPRYNSTMGLEPGTVTSASETPEPEFSNVVVLILKDAEKAKSYIDKFFPLSGELPKEGESAEYPVPIPGAQLALSREGTPMLKFSNGPQSQSFLKFEGANLKENGSIKTLMQASPEGLVYLEYMDLQPAYDAVMKALEEAKDDPEAAAAAEFLKKLKNRAGALQAASSVTATPKGLRYRARGFSPGAMSVVGIGAAIAVPNFIRARGQGELTACKSNLKNIGTGLEMYSTDWSGAYPSDLGKLTPNYLRTIPDCPTAGENTYSASYSKVKTEQGWDSYEVCCKGENHIGQGVPANYPAYNGIIGLQERP